MNESVDTLTSSAIAGDADALSALLVRHDKTLREWLRGRVNRRYQAAFDVDDVLQVTYLESFLRIGQFSSNGSESFLAWLRRIATNNLHDAIRELNRDKRPPREKQIDPAVAEDSYVSLLYTLESLGTTPSMDAARKEAEDLLETALRKLPPDYEEVVRLFDLMGRNAAQVAAAMQRSVGAVYMLKARAHDRLAELLGDSTSFFLKKA